MASQLARDQVAFGRRDPVERRVHIDERQIDSAAFVAHVEHAFGKHAERFLSLVVYGAPDAAARRALDSFNATYMHLFDGFSRP